MYAFCIWSSTIVQNFDYVRPSQYTHTHIYIYYIYIKNIMPWPILVFKRERKKKKYVHLRGAPLRVRMNEWNLMLYVNGDKQPSIFRACKWVERCKQFVVHDVCFASSEYSIRTKYVSWKIIKQRTITKYCRWIVINRCNDRIECFILSVLFYIRQLYLKSTK